jgi:hypothetical protein
MEYLTLISIILLVIVAVGFYIFYCRLNENKYVVEELRKTVKHFADKEPQVYERPTANTDKDLVNSTSNVGGSSKPDSVLNTNNPNTQCLAQNKQSGGIAQSENQLLRTREECLSNHGNIVNEQKVPVNICAASEPSEESHNCTNYAPIPDEVDNVQLTSMDNMSEFPADLLSPSTL